MILYFLTGWWLLVFKFKFVNKRFFVFLLLCFSVFVLIKYSVISKGKEPTSLDEIMIRPLVSDNDISRIIDRASRSKVVVIGDSRFENITRDAYAYSIPQNFSFIAKSAMEVNWFKTDALDQLRKILDNRETGISYHIIINMGVNDIQFYRPFDESINTYLNVYSSLIKNYSDVHFYLLSINPIDEEKLIITQPYNYRTNEDIDYFNNKLISFSNVNNITYCPANEHIDFQTDDGIHYTQATNQKIINYLARYCVKYN